MDEQPTDGQPKPDETNEPGEQKYKPERERNGYWKKGQSGNPKGRPNGRNKITQYMMELLEGDAERLSRKAIELALAGDVTALKLCLDRLLPLRKGAPIIFPLPRIERATDLPAAVASVTDAVSTGQISPEEGAAVAVVLEAQRRSFELADHENRLRLIEGALQEAREAPFALPALEDVRES